MTNLRGFEDRCNILKHIDLTIAIFHSEERVDLCKSDSDCGRQDPNSECRYDTAAALRKCECKPFYVIDSSSSRSSFGSCVPGPDAGCDIKVFAF